MLIKWTTWKKWAFLEKYNFPKLNQEEVQNLNKPITYTEIETVIRNFPANKAQVQTDSFTAEFYQEFKEELTPSLLKVFQKIAEEGKLPNSFYEATITLITTPEKDATQKIKLQANITDEHRCKILNKILAIRIQHTLKRLYIMTKWALFQGCKDSSVWANQSM